MKEYDPWLIQLPDGRVLKAKSTTSVRYHIESGNIPRNSMARRDPNEEWIGLAWVDEFADLYSERARSRADLELPAMPAPSGSKPDVTLSTGISARLDPMRLQTVGIRGFVDELIAAFDSTVSSGKLVFACLASLIGSLGVFLITYLVHLAYPDGAWLAQILGGAGGLSVLAVVVALLTRQTHLELSTMRPVSSAEARRGVGPFVRGVLLGYVATIGVGIGLLVLLQHVPGWVANGGSSASTGTEILLTAVWGVGLFLAVGIFAVILLSFLLPPILIVEECSVADAIREWRALIRDHRIRVMVYEGLALALAFIAALPLILPVHLALHHGPQLASAVPPNWFTAVIPLVLTATALGPALAFLSVANLFIYLNLRYEYSAQK